MIDTATNVLSEKEISLCRNAINKRIQFCNSMLKAHPKTYELIYSVEIVQLNVVLEKLEEILNSK